MNCNRLSDLECYFMGDFNVNLNCVKNQSTLLSSLKNWCNVFDFSQLIQDFTRISSTSSTLFDHIYVSHKEKLSQSGVTNCGLSDHCLIYCMLNIAKDLVNKHSILTFGNKMSIHNVSIFSKIKSERTFEAK